MAQGDAGPVIGPELAAFLEQGVAVIAATRDDRMQPEITRGWGPHVSAGGRELTLCLSMPPGSASRSNLEENGQIAITFSLPTTYRSVQVKGRAEQAGEPTPEQRSRMEAHIALFVEQVERIGMSPSHAARIPVPPFAAVRCSVRELYDQTPGAGAGAPL